jgi:hypothetical protein
MISVYDFFPKELEEKEAHIREERGITVDMHDIVVLFHQDEFDKNETDF